MMLREFFPIASRVSPASLRPVSATATKKTLFEFRSDFDARIHAGIQRVLAKAWQAVPDPMAEEDRFKIAKRNAQDEIARLSPSIKRQAERISKRRSGNRLKCPVKPTKVPRHKTGHRARKATCFQHVQRLSSHEPVTNTMTSSTLLTQPELAATCDSLRQRGRDRDPATRALAQC